VAGDRARTRIPGVVRVLDSGRTPVGAFVVSEWSRGIDLGRLVARVPRRAGGRRVSAEVALSLGIDVGRVLAAAHKASPPLPHHGLAPGNVRVSADNVLSVADFGVFASVRGLVDHPLRKWYFVAPELLAAGEQTDDVDALRADIYSLGALLHFLASGRPPFKAESMAQLLECAWSGLPRIPGAPPPLADAIRTLTNAEPSKRPDSLESVILHLATLRRALVEHEDSVSKRGIAAKEIPDNASVRPEAKSQNLAGMPAPGEKTVQQATTTRSRSKIVAVGVFSAVVVLAALALLVTAHHFRKVSAFHREGDHHPSPEMSGGHPRNRTRLASPEMAPPLVAARRNGGDAGTPAAGPGSPIKTALIGIRGKEGAAPRFVDEEESGPRIAPLPGHLYVDTLPRGAGLWVDGDWKGKTPLDAMIGHGIRRVMVFLPGYYMLRETVNGNEGSYFRRALRPIPPPPPTNAFLNVVCETPGKLPILVDGRETGFLCPTKNLPIQAGKHAVGVYVQEAVQVHSVEVNAAPGPTPTLVRLPL